LRLRAMRHSGKSTLRYAAQRGVDSALCHTGGSRDTALCSIGGSRDTALCGIALSCDSALCATVRSPHIFANFSANLQQYTKIF
jgi:hypothetical protein